MVSRRQFLRGDLAGKTSPLRPPGALAETEFVTACRRCGDCLQACPERILIPGPGGYPALDFALGACSFCGACQRACPTGALRADGSGAPAHRVAQIGADCLARHGVVCRSCGDACLLGAIGFPPLAGAVSLPVVAAAACTGCGACVGVCPQRAVTVRAL
ncbi:ferredoxin-type protein NapF [Denitratisoma sp. DHT3]|uniref:ferredoxin-type protein NapF n=1 Tax=Denitratisoma sp. DHT3 TaxID=1981880 RepID=UPI001198A7B7|nr:ferredoxin-type protein NapF [Denitratisoma sp. DHT3]QDX82384.1 ferredoxin-type protein NapF [Denitratisoma sp. DHT3]